MTHFDKSALPPARSFYERELGRLTRPDRKGWVRGNCPFHKSKSGKSFAANLDSAGYYCFGCDARGGDVVAFFMKRYSLNFKGAAQRLGAWRGEGLSPADRQRIERDRRDREAKRLAAEAEAEQRRQERIAARDHLYTLERLQRATGEELIEMERQTPGLESKDKDFLFGTLVLLCDQIREAEATYQRLAGIGEAK